MTSSTHSVLLLALLTVSPKPASACSVAWGTTSSAADRDPNLRARALLSDAEIVVRARVVGFLVDRDSSSDVPTPYPRSRARFQIVETLKGHLSSDSLVIPGRETLVDEFNAASIPYANVRRSGLMGSCFTYDYRRGGEYLLLLKTVHGIGVTPYWAPIAPVNEQLHPTSDAWLQWVRMVLAKR